MGMTQNHIFSLFLFPCPLWALNPEPLRYVFNCRSNQGRHHCSLFLTSADLPHSFIDYRLDFYRLGLVWLPPIPQHLFDHPEDQADTFLSLSPLLPRSVLGWSQHLCSPLLCAHRCQFGSGFPKTDFSLICSPGKTQASGRGTDFCDTLPVLGSSCLLLSKSPPILFSFPFSWPGISQHQLNPFKRVWCGLILETVNSATNFCWTRCLLAPSMDGFLFSDPPLFISYHI